MFRTHSHGGAVTRDMSWLMPGVLLASPGDPTPVALKQKPPQLRRG